MTNKMLKKLRFSVRRYQGNLNINGYNENDLKERVCPSCLLKSLSKNDVLYIEELQERSKCNCELKIPSIVNLKLDIKKNEKIFII